MWQQEVGFLELFLAYFDLYKDSLAYGKRHRDFLLDILLCHERVIQHCGLLPRKNQDEMPVLEPYETESSYPLIQPQVIVVENYDNQDAPCSNYVITKMERLRNHLQGIDQDASDDDHIGPTPDASAVFSLEMPYRGTVSEDEANGLALFKHCKTELMINDSRMPPVSMSVDQEEDDAEIDAAEVYSKQHVLARLGKTEPGDEVVAVISTDNTWCPNSTDQNERDIESDEETVGCATENDVQTVKLEVDNNEQESQPTNGREDITETIEDQTRSTQNTHTTEANTINLPNSLNPQRLQAQVASVVSRQLSTETDQESQQQPPVQTQPQQPATPRTQAQQQPPNVQPLPRQQLLVQPIPQKQLPVQPQSQRQLPLQPQNQRHLPVQHQPQKQLPVQPQAQKQLPVRPQSIHAVPSIAWLHQQHQQSRVVTPLPNCTDQPPPIYRQAPLQQPVVEAFASPVVSSAPNTHQLPMFTQQPIQVLTSRSNSNHLLIQELISRHQPMTIPTGVHLHERNKDAPPQHRQNQYTPTLTQLQDMGIPTGAHLHRQQQQQDLPRDRPAVIQLQNLGLPSTAQDKHQESTNSVPSQQSSQRNQTLPTTFSPLVNLGLPVTQRQIQLSQKDFQALTSVAQRPIHVVPVVNADKSKTSSNGVYYIQQKRPSENSENPSITELRSLRSHQTQRPPVTEASRQATSASNHPQPPPAKRVALDAAVVSTANNNVQSLDDPNKRQTLIHFFPSQSHEPAPIPPDTRASVPPEDSARMSAGTPSTSPAIDHSANSTALSPSPPLTPSFLRSTNTNNARKSDIGIPGLSLPPPDPNHRRTYICSLCRKYYRSYDQFARHPCSLAYINEAAQHDRANSGAGPTSTNLVHDQTPGIKETRQSVEQSRQMQSEKPQQKQSQQSTKSRQESSRNSDYPCSICKRIFTRSGDRVRHEKTHSMNRKCRGCTKEFTRPSSLRVHESRCSMVTGSDNINGVFKDKGQHGNQSQIQRTTKDSNR